MAVKYGDVSDNVIDFLIVSLGGEIVIKETSDLYKSEEIEINFREWMKITLKSFYEIYQTDSVFRRLYRIYVFVNMPLTQKLINLLDFLITRGEFDFSCGSLGLYKSCLNAKFAVGYFLLLHNAPNDLCEFISHPNSAIGFEFFRFVNKESNNIDDEELRERYRQSLDGSIYEYSFDSRKIFNGFDQYAPVYFAFGLLIFELVLFLIILTVCFLVAQFAAEKHRLLNSTDVYTAIFLDVLFHSLLSFYAYIEGKFDSLFKPIEVHVPITSFYEWYNDHMSQITLYKRLVK